MQFVHYISRTVQPCLHPLAIPTATLFATTSRTPTRLSAERVRRSGRSNLPFLLLVYAQPRSQPLGMRALSRLRLLGLAASSNGPSVRGTLSRGAHLVLGEEYAHFHRFPAYARNWWSIRTSGTGRPPPIHGGSSRSLDREPKVDRAISKITARDGLCLLFATRRWTSFLVGLTCVLANKILCRILNRAVLSLKFCCADFCFHVARCEDHRRKGSRVQFRAKSAF